MLFGPLLMFFALRNVLSARSDEFVLDVWNTGPACLDSKIDFTASLRSSDGSPLPYEPFDFLWNNSASHQSSRDISGPTATLLMIFTSSQVHRPGRFSMRVSVFSLLNVSTPVATATNDFNLTENFGVVVDLTQNLCRRKWLPRDIFVAGCPIVATAAVADRFVDPAFTFCWQMDAQLDCTNSSLWTASFSSAGQHWFGLTVNASVSVPDGVRSQRSSLPFVMNLTLKENLTGIEIRGGQGQVSVGEEYVVHISCRGSDPFNISWSVTDSKNDSFIFEGAVRNLKSCYYVFRHVFDDLGSYRVTVTIENVVDLEDRTLGVQVSTVRTPPLSPAVVPVMCVIIAMVTLGLLVWSYFCVPNREPVETANFEFYSPANSISLRFSGRLRGLAPAESAAVTLSLSDFEMQSLKNYGTYGFLNGSSSAHSSL